MEGTIGQDVLGVGDDGRRRWGRNGFFKVVGDAEWKTLSLEMKSDCGMKSTL